MNSFGWLSANQKKISNQIGKSRNRMVNKIKTVLNGEPIPGGKNIIKVGSNIYYFLIARSGSWPVNKLIDEYVEKKDKNFKLVLICPNEPNEDEGYFYSLDGELLNKRKNLLSPTGYSYYSISEKDIKDISGIASTGYANVGELCKKLRPDR